MAISIDDIKDEKSLEAWLNERPEAVRQNCAVFIAMRSALRVFPIAVDGFQFSDWAVRKSKVSLPIFRVLLVTCLTQKFTKRDDILKANLMESVQLSQVATWDIQDEIESNCDGAVEAAIFASETARSITLIQAFQAVSFVFSDTIRAVAKDSTDTATASVWSHVRADCKIWMDHSAADGTCGIDVAPLIKGEFVTAPDWSTVRDKLLNDTDPDRGADWSFWNDWYDKILRGDPQDWDLLYDIAVSDDIDWEASPREVNAAIARIVEKHRLLREIADLKAQRDQLASFTASIEARSHNMPPELVDDHVHVAPSFQIIWEKLDEAEEELRSETPEPTRLAKIGQVIVNAAAVILKYCGQKADIMINEATKTIGTAGGKALIVYAGAQTEAAQKIGHGLIEFARLLVGG